MQTQVAFYLFSTAIFKTELANLVRKIVTAGQKVLLVCNDEKQLQELDHTLWTFSRKDFIPHCNVHEHQCAPQLCCVVLSLDTTTNINNADVILNLQAKKTQSTLYKRKKKSINS